MTVQSLFLPVRHVARLTVEAVTPLSISSGESDADLDAPLFRDWNGLPCLSATSVAGVLRSAFADYHAGAGDVFGQEDRAAYDGQASRLLVSFGLAHDSQGRASSELLDATHIERDPVLALLARPAPILRDSVAINGMGAARENAKYDRAAVPAGTRFSLDLAIDGEADASAQARDRSTLLGVVGLLSSPYVRFGGATRRGLGRVRLVADLSWIGALNRTGRDGRERWIAFRRSPLHEAPKNCGFELVGALDALPASARGPVSTQLKLRFKGYWRTGQGRRPWTIAAADQAGSLSRMPLSEPVIHWTGRRGVVGNIADPNVAVLPGAGLKGALAHRAEFHLRRLEGRFGPISDDVRLIDSLMGSVNDGANGRAGALLIDDIQIDYSAVARDQSAGRRKRNSIDRHTGGVRSGKLFEDEALWRGPLLTVPITVMAASVEDENALQALDWAIADLCAGELAVGSGDAIGDGVMRIEDKCEVVWSGGVSSLLEAARLARQAIAS